MGITEENNYESLFTDNITKFINSPLSKNVYLTGPLTQQHGIRTYGSSISVESVLGQNAKNRDFFESISIYSEVNLNQLLISLSPEFLKNRTHILLEMVDGTSTYCQLEKFNEESITLKSERMNNKHSDIEIEMHHKYSHNENLTKLKVRNKTHETTIIWMHDEDSIFCHISTQNEITP